MPWPMSSLTPLMARVTNLLLESHCVLECSRPKTLLRTIIFKSGYLDGFELLGPVFDSGDFVISFFVSICPH